MQRLFLMNILLTFIWAALTGNFSLGNFTLGFLLSYVILWVLSRNEASVSYFKRVPRIISFAFFFLKELFKANIQVAYDIITPANHMKPGIVGVPLDAKTDLEIAMLSNFIALTPGTLGIDVSSDKKYLYIHAVYIKDKKDYIHGIKNGFERKLLDIMR